MLLFQGDATWRKMQIKLPEWDFFHPFCGECSVQSTHKEVMK